MTASAVGTRAVALFSPVLFLASHLPDAVVALWLVFLTFQSLVAALNGALPVVFMNMASYAHSGASSLNLVGEISDGDYKLSGPNWPLLNQLSHCMVRVFRAVAIAWLLLASTVGTLVVLEPVSRTDLGMEAWAAWFVFAGGAASRILQQGYVAYLLGVGQVTGVRRLESISWLLGGIGATLALWLTQSFLLATTLLQIPLIVNLYVLALMARRYGWDTNLAAPEDIQLIRNEVLPRAWRGSVGILASHSAVYGSGLFYAQIGSSSEVSAYLFSLSVIGILSTFAMSPYSARMPAISRLWAQRSLSEQNRLAAEGIVASIAVFSLLAVVVPLVIRAMNLLLSANLPFVDGAMWALMILSTALLRYGALHLQYYTVTNDMKWHIVDTTNGVLYLTCLAVLFNGSVEILPISQSIALMLFYVPYSRYLTRSSFNFPLEQDAPKSGGLIALAISVVTLFHLAFLEA